MAGKRAGPCRFGEARRSSDKTDGFRCKPWDEFAQPDSPKLDFVITVCDNAAGEVCPIWLGRPMSAPWGRLDPAAVEGTDVEVALAFAETYRMLNNRISAFSNLKLSDWTDCLCKPK